MRRHMTDTENMFAVRVSTLHSRTVHQMLLHAIQRSGWGWCPLCKVAVQTEPPIVLYAEQEAGRAASQGLVSSDGSGQLTACCSASAAKAASSCMGIRFRAMRVTPMMSDPCLPPRFCTASHKMSSHACMCRVIGRMQVCRSCHSLYS